MWVAIVSVIMAINAAKFLEEFVELHIHKAELWVKDIHDPCKCIKLGIYSPEIEKSIVVSIFKMFQKSNSNRWLGL